MKRSIYLLFLSLPLLYSCDKNEDREPKTTFKFKVDGGWGPIEMGVSGSLENTDTGAIIERAPITEGNHYVLRAKDYPFDVGHSSFIAKLRLPASLAVGTYTYGYSNIGSYPPNFSANCVMSLSAYPFTNSGGFGVYWPNDRDSFAITITKVANGYVSGTFNAPKLSGASIVSRIRDITITEGEFEHVKVIQ